MDQGKAAAALCTNGGIVQDWEDRPLNKTPLTLFCIPTTAGTGSEVTSVAVITDTKRHFKLSLQDPEKLFPTVAICDPELTLTLPPKLTASTGMDALTHAIEAYTVHEKNPFSDALALQAAELIGKSLPEAFCGGNNLLHREKMMAASTMAGMAFINSNVGAVHALAETVGALYDIPHGVANSVFLPYVMEFNLPVCGELYCRIGKQIGALGGEGSCLKIRELNRRLSIPLFSQIPGIQPEMFPEIAQRTADNILSQSNARHVEQRGYLEILHKAWREYQW